jgi:hypothetical protein
MGGFNSEKKYLREETRVRYVSENIYKKKYVLERIKYISERRNTYPR